MTVLRYACFIGMIVLGASATQAASVKEVFEKHDLIGTFAWDCTKPASKSNWYYITRVIDTGHVQRDFMVSPTAREWVAIIDSVTESSANEIATSGTVDGERGDGIWRLQTNRMQQWATSRAGKPLIANGRFINGGEIPWFNKCAGSAKISVAGNVRSYVFERPPLPGPRPTILVLHGLNGSGADTARTTGLDKVASREGVVAVFPDRQPPMIGWNFFPPGKELPLLIERARSIGGPPDDVGFLKALIADLVGRGISDPKRVYIAGISNGSFMALRMICVDADRFAALALVISGMPETVGESCRPAKPIPVAILNGTADRVVPYVGGPVNPGALFSTWPTDREVAFFRRLNNCPEVQETSNLPNVASHRMVMTRWTGCAGGDVALYKILDGEHSTYNFNVGQWLLDFIRNKVRSD
jgi:polyhydroxybutyrate depolymerase